MLNKLIALIKKPEPSNTAAIEAALQQNKALLQKLLEEQA